MAVEAVRWQASGLNIIDQVRLPHDLLRIDLTTLQDVWNAIKRLQVRGAPAIGVCAAYGVVVGVLERAPQSVPEAERAATESAEYLATSRPTAVNLFWALDRMKAAAGHAANAGTVEEFASRLLEEAHAICREDQEMCRSIGRHGASLIAEGSGVLTHCNAGALATSSVGTALAPMFCAHESGRRFQVFADETRPLLQGARLTAWELLQEGIDVTLICDNMAAQVMREGKVQLVIVGADRIAANGDTANKIGTYGVALAAHAHNIPFYVAAPYSTFDLDLPNGDAIPIEQRDASEITQGFGTPTAPRDIKVYNPAFDVTPAQYIAGFITDQGILRPPYPQSIADFAKR